MKFFLLISRLSLWLAVVDANLLLFERDASNLVPRHPFLADTAAGSMQFGGALEVMDILMKRQSTCPAGYGLCTSGGCCPIGGKCCGGNLCAAAGNFCCGTSKQCNTASEICCGGNGCAPLGSECCGDNIGYCEAGNHCYRLNGQTRDVCCTNNLCTARVYSGSTSYLPVATPTVITTPIATVGVYLTYTYTVTWYYYYYFWTYRAAISASTVTSTRSTETTTLYVSATNSAAARASLSAITVDLPTPAAATSLAPFTGSTRSGSATGNGGLFTTPNAGSSVASRASAGVTSIVGGSASAAGRSHSPTAVWQVLVVMLLPAVLMWL